jgi:protein-S-isoprenylcysteine O-methyltransferase Ste14
VSLGRHLRAIGLLPGMVAVVVPALIVSSGGVDVGWGLPRGAAVLPVLLGVALIGAGLVLVGWTVALLATVGRGTLAPWDPTSRLVVRGPYRHVRNPMISGVQAVLLGETVLLGSRALLAWTAGFVVVNAMYLPLVEEPGLARRFGADYDAYRANVPRWVPRARPWEPSGNPVQIDPGAHRGTDDERHG